jgi:hypothetical protein
MIKKLKQAKDKVKALLVKSPHLRDDDNKLIATYYYHESQSNLLKITALDFLHEFADGKFTNPETIRRCRQRLQEECPELRGKLWHEKQHAGNEVRKEVVNL